jgi:NAD(P)-dependent dehydrogenase (short-subunit alcohol dehydrogenase family)
MAKTPIALITGANSGLGQAIAESLAIQHGYHVIIGSRNPADGEAVATSLRERGCSASNVQIDLLSDESIHKAVKEIEAGHSRLDALVNNAGVHLEISKTDLSTRDLLSRSFQANSIGPAILTEACLPLLSRAEAPRVVFVSSGHGSIAQALDKSWAWYGIAQPAYKASKAALNMLAVRYVIELEAIGGMVNMVCPGFVKTKMVGFHPDARSPEVAAEKVVELATLAKGGPTGTFVDANGVLPW